MNIQEPKIKYRKGMPFDAELCKIRKQLPHRHTTELELVYCLEGTVHLIAADQDYILTPGQIHSIDFYDLHYLNGSDDNITLIFHLDLSQLPEWEDLRYVFYACESNHCFPYQEPAMNQVKDIILALSYIYFTNNKTEADCSPAVRSLADLLLQYFNWFNYENQDEYMNQDLFDRFTRVLEYIGKNYREKITVSQLAEREHMNRNYFSQFISKTVFSSFSNMVNYIRCYNAETLLLTTEKSIADISFECGFSDPKYFYSAFKTLWHMTPTEDRERYQAQYHAASFKKNSDTILSDNVAANKVKEYITTWHLEKNL
ncbi:MAG: AraC family transcriptional regulator [Clostridia bacterium]|nr:AraC family transcriptional regulator [Clostridia bacterium]